MNIQPEDFLVKLHRGDELPHVLVAYGEESYYRQAIRRALPVYVYGETPEEDRDISLFEENTNLGEVEAAINTYPFFSGKSLVIISDEKLLAKSESEEAKRQRERLGKLLSDVPDYCTVLVVSEKLDGRTSFFKGLSKVGAVCKCEPLKTRDVSAWLLMKAQEQGGKLGRDALERILEYLEPTEKAPLQLLEQELIKLSLYAGGRKQWTAKDVDAVFASLPEMGSFALSNAMVERKLLAALEILAAEKKKGTPVIKLCGGLMYQLRKLLKLRELEQQGYDAKRMGEALNMKYAFSVKKSLEQSKKFSVAALQQALLEMGQLNIDLRKGGRQYERLEEILVALLGR